MRTRFTILAAVLISAGVFSQVPQKMSYQAVIRDVNMALLTNHIVGMQISILQGSTSGTVVYTESQTPTTNANGLVSIEIGGGPGFDAINWSNNTYFIKTEIDPTGGTNYTIIGTSQLLSVPYALNSKTAEYSYSGDYLNLTNKPDLFDGQYSSLTGSPTSVSAFTNDAGYLKSFTETDPKIGTNTSGYSPKWDGSALVTGTIYQDATGNVGIGTTNPYHKLQVQNGNLVIDRPVSTSILSLGTVAGTIGRIFAGDAGGGSLNTNYNQIKMTANPANTEELLRLHTGADAMSNTGTVALYFGQFNLTDMAAIKAVNEGGQPLNRTAGLSFWTEPEGTGVPLQERMRITGKGNIGIGTNNPSTRLDVNGVITATAGNSTNWNNAFSWGNHAGLYRPVSYVPGWSEITGKPAGNNTGDMLYWDGTSWATVPAGQPGQFLQMTSSNIPAWAGASFPIITTAVPSSITDNTATCGGNVANDGGANVTARGICWSTSPNPTITNNKTIDGSGTGTFTSSMTGLTFGTTYYVRAYALNSAGTAYGNEISFATTSIVTDPYSLHTITLDGINDFNPADEQFSTTSTGYNAYFAWDANYFYVGYKGSDINALSSSKWLIIYLDGTPGTATGMTLHTQTPSLPFPAKYVFMWRTTNDFFGSWIYNGSSWAGPSSVSASDYSKSNDYFEMRIPLSSIGNPSKLKVHVNMLNEAAGSEWTYGGVPANSFSDRYDPDYLHYYHFDFSNTLKPKDYVSQ